MYALLILDMQVGLVHSPDRPWGREALLETLNRLIRNAREADAPIFLAATWVRPDRLLSRAVRSPSLSQSCS